MISMDGGIRDWREKGFRWNSDVNNLGRSDLDLSKRVADLRV